MLLKTEIGMLHEDVGGGGGNKNKGNYTHTAPQHTYV